jgi:hypothetical protein
MFGLSKYMSIVFKLLFLSALLVGPAACTISNSVRVPLSELNIQDKRFLDTNVTKTTFYLGLFNVDGYDRYSGTVFQDMMYRMTAEQSVKNEEKPIEYFEGSVYRKGLNVVFELSGIYKSEPKLSKRKLQADALVLEDSIPSGVSMVTQSINSDPDLPGISPAAVKEIVIEEKMSPVSKQTRTDKLDDRLIIIACFKENYFQEYMLEAFENELAEIEYYTAKGWVRVYLKDFPGYRIYEAKEVFPDAWRTYYGQ